MIRESWLEQMIDLLRPDFENVGHPLPATTIRVSCGWPSKGALARKKMRVGECRGVEASDDKSFQVFISPVLKESVEVLGTLVHELVHTVAGIECKHRKPFTTIAKAIGLEGKMTETVAGDALTARLKVLIETLGPYPHAKLVASHKPKTQTCRQLKVVCAACGCICRMSQKALDDPGPPTCACGGQMAAEGGEDLDEEGGDE